MADKPATEVPAPFPVKRVLTNPGASPREIHTFNWTRIGSSVHLEASCFDFVELREALEKSRKGEKAEPVKLFVVDRFSLTPEAAQILLRNAQEIVDDLKATGVIKGSEATR